MSQIDDFENPSGDSAEEAFVLKGRDFSPAEISLESTESLQAEDVFETECSPSQGTTSVVPQHSQNEAGALAPEGSLSPISTGAPGPDSGTWQPPASSAPFELSTFTCAPPEPPPPARIPHLGHLALLAAFLLFGFVCMIATMGIALLVHFNGVTKIDQIKTNVIYLLGSEAVLYLVALALGFFLFPLFWQKSFFEGIQWRVRTALHWKWQLTLIAMGCFGLAMLDEVLLPGPKHAPIEDLFRSPGAAWMIFFFGVTLAPFFEEIFFRGFLLPSLATAWDWTVEKSTGKASLPLDENGHPQWSLAAMIAAAIPTSLLFALIHADQQGHSLGPFLLLVTVSLILCAVRLKLRSVAASTLVHASYNFLIFSVMLISTGGFRHLDKM
ncbi:MAG: CPBP family intramembrane glutamic endopeptidase [Terracidiphilus sp.]